jgi:hypothetical protein
MLLSQGAVLRMYQAAAVSMQSNEQWGVTRDPGSRRESYCFYVLVFTCET